MKGDYLIDHDIEEGLQIKYMLEIWLCACEMDQEKGQWCVSMDESLDSQQ